MGTRRRLPCPRLLIRGPPQAGVAPRIQEEEEEEEDPRLEMEGEGIALADTVTSRYLRGTVEYR